MKAVRWFQTACLFASVILSLPILVLAFVIWGSARLVGLIDLWGLRWGDWRAFDPGGVLLCKHNLKA